MIIKPVFWTAESEFDIDSIYQFYLQISEELALKIISEIIYETEKIVFSDQYQVDDINSKYRRIIVRHFKVLYKNTENKIIVYAVFDCRMDDNKLKMK